MSDEQFDAVTDPSEQQIERAVAHPGPDEAVAAPVTPDEESLELLDSAEEGNRGSESDVTEEDLSSADRIHDGALPEDLEQSAIGQREFVEDQADPSREATIDSRLRQEEPEAGFDVVPSHDAREPEEDQLDEEDLP